MNTLDRSLPFSSALREVDCLATAIAKRGYDDAPQEWDDYSLLIQTHEFRKLITFELYEGYFSPRRHEFELHLLTQLVDAVAASKPAAFLAGAAVGGVVGNAVYDLLKAALAHIVSRFKGVRRTCGAVQEIADNVEKVRTYMDSHEEAGTGQIASDLGIEEHKIQPVLKLLGCRSRRHKKRTVWRKPDIW